MLLASTAILSCSACGRTNLNEYAPLGTSARQWFPSLSLDLAPYVIVDPRDAKVTHLEFLSFYSYVVNGHRFSTVGFRCLCALLNRYFGEWERLVIIERVDFVKDQTGFLVAAVSRDGLVGVTNLRWDGPGFTSWEATPRPRIYSLDRPKFESCLSELDKARDVLGRDLLWFNNIDWPLYLLHDIKSDGSYLSIGVCGWADTDDAERARLLKARPDYAKAAALVHRAKPWQPIPSDGAETEKELQQAGATYASLIARVWESTLGRPDYTVTGTPPR
jgi:hypothetical protein